MIITTAMARGSLSTRLPNPNPAPNVTILHVPLGSVVLLEEHMVAVVMAMVTIDRSVFGIYRGDGRWLLLVVGIVIFFHSVILHRRSKNKK